VSLVKHTPAEFISGPEQILKEIYRSKSTGNVLAIWAAPFGDTMHITAVDDIKDIVGSPTRDKLVILKKYDLQGIYINDHEICLSEISRIRRFNRKYHDAIALFDRLEEPDELDYLVKIKRLEQTVTAHELQIILIRIINSGYRIAINLFQDAQVFAESCYVISFESGPIDRIMASCQADGRYLKVVDMKDIESIEFDFFYSYKGLSSRIFRVSRDVH
jgi:hypothetical protein